MNKDLEKKNKFMHFIEKWFIIGIILFVLVQISVGIIIKMNTKESDQESFEEYNKDYIGHWYSGTFFINMTVKENFESYEKYEEMNQEYDKDNIVKICKVIGGISMLTGLGLLIIAGVKEKKKKLLEKNTPNIILLSGIFLLLYRIFEEIDLFIVTTYWRKYSKGFLSTSGYYLQIYNFIIPILLISLGVIYRQKQRKDLKKLTTNNERIIKTISTFVIIFGFSFILYRFGIRVFELFTSNNIRLPFYYYLVDLPKEFALSSNSYNKLVIFRFIKDLPMFISSVISLILFVKILLSSINDKIISTKNNKRFKIIFISLLVASLIFNILGIFEVKILNSEFLYQYKDAVYTIAVRSLTEPPLYAFFIYLFKHYIELGYSNKAKE